MSLLSAYKAARIAHAVERDIKKRMDPLFLRVYNNQYAYGTKVGNHIFDSVAKRSRAERLSEADDFMLSILYLLLQARADGSDGAASRFNQIIVEVFPHIVGSLSTSVTAEILQNMDDPS